MKKTIISLFTHPFFSASLFMVGGSNVVNAINYLYHVIMGRVLGPESYGDLSALFSFIGLLAIIPFSFGLIITKFISSAENDSEVKGLINWFSKRILMISIFLFITIALLSYFITSFLNLPSVTLVIVCGATFIFTLPTFLNRAVLTGLLKFKETIGSQIIETFGKLVFGLIFVALGFGVFGAMTGLFLSIVIAFLITGRFLKKYSSSTLESHPDEKKIFVYTLPVLIQSAAGTALFSSDLMLVKHYFSAYDAGIYASISTLGKIVLFATAPIASAMFPMVAKRKAEKKNYMQILFLSVSVTTLACGGLISIYALFPQIMIQILFGNNYLEAQNYLVLFASFIGLLTVASLLINYFLSVNKTRVVILPLTAAVAQVLGIVFFHSTLYEVIYISIGVSVGLLISLLLYFMISKEK